MSALTKIDRSRPPSFELVRFGLDWGWEWEIVRRGRIGKLLLTLLGRPLEVREGAGNEAFSFNRLYTVVKSSYFCTNDHRCPDLDLKAAGSGSLGGRQDLHSYILGVIACTAQ